MIVLGISGGIGHDGSACIVQDGKVLCAAEEERFIRRKRASRTAPIYATLYCLGKTGLDINEIDYLALSWNPNKCKNYWPLNYVEDFIKSPLLKREKPFEVVHVDHHVSHLIAAYANSGLSEATGIVIDGQGEDCSTTIAHIKGKEVKIVEQLPITQSLGYYYLGVLRYLNMGRTESGKLMGLASYGNEIYDLPIKIDADGYSMPIPEKNYSCIEDSNDYVIGWWIDWLRKRYGDSYGGQLVTDHTRNRVINNIPFEHLNVNLAKTAQYFLEQAIMATIKKGIGITGCKDVVYAGGVALNCSANGIIRSSGLVDQFNVYAASGDSGGSIGAALYVEGSYEPEVTEYNAYLGPSFGDSEIVDIVRKLNIKHEILADIEKSTAELLACGNVLGWFQGSMEIGPRALGARSIIADPSKKSHLDYINASIKFREWWRPLAPSFLAEEASAYVKQTELSPYMLFAYDVYEDKKQKIEAAVHIDNTTRIQSVTQDGSRFRRMIEEFYSVTGIPAVLNTSFNLDAEPIVCSPIDAIRTFYSSRLDGLVMGNVLIRKGGDKA